MQIIYILFFSSSENYTSDEVYANYGGTPVTEEYFHS